MNFAIATSSIFPLYAQKNAIPHLGQAFRKETPAVPPTLPFDGPLCRIPAYALPNHGGTPSAATRLSPFAPPSEAHSPKRNPAAIPPSAALYRVLSPATISSSQVCSYEVSEDYTARGGACQ